MKAKLTDVATLIQMRCKREVSLGSSNSDQPSLEIIQNGYAYAFSFQVYGDIPWEEEEYLTVTITDADTGIYCHSAALFTVGSYDALSIAMWIIQFCRTHTDWPFDRQVFPWE